MLRTETCAFVLVADEHTPHEVDAHSAAGEEGTTTKSFLPPEYTAMIFIVHNILFPSR